MAGVEASQHAHLRSETFPEKLQNFSARSYAPLCLQTVAREHPKIRKTQEGCGGLGGENPGAFPKAGPIFQQPFSLPDNAQHFVLPENRGRTSSSIEICPARNSDNHSLLDFSDKTGCFAIMTSCAGFACYDPVLLIPGFCRGDLG